jgi:hypothetical protein
VFRTALRLRLRMSPRDCFAGLVVCDLRFI